MIEIILIVIAIELAWLVHRGEQTYPLQSRAWPWKIRYALKNRRWP